MQEDEFPMTWVYSQCKQLTAKPRNDTTQSKQFNEIIKILMEDKNSKGELETNKNEIIRLCDIIAKKMKSFLN